MLSLDKKQMLRLAVRVSEFGGAESFCSSCSMILIIALQINSALVTLLVNLGFHARLMASSDLACVIGASLRISF